MYFSVHVYKQILLIKEHFHKKFGIHENLVSSE